MAKQGADATAARTVFDLVVTNDVASLLTSVRGVNPYDVSPGMQRQREQQQRQIDKQSSPHTHTDEAATAAVLRGNVVLDRVDVRGLSQMRDARGNTPLHVAAGLGHVQLVRALLEECACAVDVYNDDGYTPLHLAARHGRLACVRCLCAHGANVLRLTRYADTRCCYGAATKAAAAAASSTLSLLSLCDEATMLRGDGGCDSCACCCQGGADGGDACAAGGRTAVFLAHWHQHHAVAAELAPHFCRARPLHASQHAAASSSSASSMTAAAAAAAQDEHDDKDCDDEDAATADAAAAASAAAATSTTTMTSSVGGGNSHAVTRLRTSIVAAALTLDTLVFAQLFDVMDCQPRRGQRTATATAGRAASKVTSGGDDDVSCGCCGSTAAAAPACGPLPVRWAAHEVCNVVRGVTTLLPHITPLEGGMMPEQLFIFHGLLKRGLLRRGDGSASGGNEGSGRDDDDNDKDGDDDAILDEALDRVLRGGQALAFRLLWQHERAWLLRRMTVTTTRPPPPQQQDAAAVQGDDDGATPLPSPPLSSASVPHECANVDGARVLRLLLREVEQRASFARALAAVRRGRRRRSSSRGGGDDDDTATELLQAHASLQSLRAELAALHEPPLP